MPHEEYLNLPGVKGGKKLTYLQYLVVFDKFTPPQCNITRQEKMTEQYFSYVGSLAQYLESFIRRVKPLEDLEKLFRAFDEEFEQSWEMGMVPGWEAKQAAQSNGGAAKPEEMGGVWCADCEREFKNDNVYKAHLTGKKHIKNAQVANGTPNGDTAMSHGITTSAGGPALARLKERAVAEREHRIQKLASAMSTEREDTRVNVERKAGMTDRERQQELAALFAEDSMFTNATATGDADAADADDDEKVYNPLKLPLAWDGKPIPFWLYKLHGLGVEFPCEICGNYVYMGRRAFDKHFSEQRHIYGLKCLGITQTGLFSQITGIEEAQRLWDKIQRDKKLIEERKGGAGVEEMEDTQGHVMPRKVYEDLRKAGLL
ncbi:Pre-mRNA-splicing factor sap61 [Friedmanniomyces endolithicus]|uniref:Pre-mRNA-splicing factor sap61 n=1 Tax=Friedmanniomyces endolithicus TaxID=329885 RepID=A0AAN6K712_9PEZI|nr:Pre-mRNA-splicing factor sap61 [Friedmanniomyces endolithicus]KAK0967996.1 Pre-mRNA-splicing factor sap61 [Friedmanniomyces endolithicus]